MRNWVSLPGQSSHLLGPERSEEEEAGRLPAAWGQQSPWAHGAAFSALPQHRVSCSHRPSSTSPGCRLSLAITGLTGHLFPGTVTWCRPEVPGDCHPHPRAQPWAVSPPECPRALSHSTAPCHYTSLRPRAAVRSHPCVLAADVLAVVLLGETGTVALCFS